MRNLDVKGRTTDKAREFDFSLLNEFVGVNFQLINLNAALISINLKFLSQTLLSRRKLQRNFHCEMAVIHSELSSILQMQSRKAKLSQFLTCSLMMLLNGETTNTLQLTFLFNFAKQNIC